MRTVTIQNRREEIRICSGTWRTMKWSSSTNNLAFDRDFDTGRFWNRHVFRRQRTVFSELQFQSSAKKRLSTALSQFDAIGAELPEEWIANEENQSGNFDIDAMREILNRYQLTEFWKVLL